MRYPSGSATAVVTYDTRKMSSNTKENEASEVYPMPMFVTLEVSDVTKSTEWYQDILGFTNVFQQPTVAHVRYRKYGNILLVSGGDEYEERGHGVTTYFNVEDETVEDVTERAKEAGASASGPYETGHNTREITITDPDGYTMKFSEPIDTSRNFEDVMEVSYEK